MSSSPIPQQPAPGQPQQNGADAGQAQGDPLSDFRAFAQQAQALAQKYPEATEGVVKILQEVKGIMTRVASNPQRTPPQQSPPNG